MIIAGLHRPTHTARCILLHNEQQEPNLRMHKLKYHLLDVIVTKGVRAFAVGAPRLWNNLPEDIRSAQSVISFKYFLKTCFLFLCFVNVFFFLCCYFLTCFQMY